MSIGENIKKWREIRNLKQSELAEMIGVSDKTVSSWEIDRTEPKMGMVEKISTALNCRKTDIIGISDFEQSETSSDIELYHFSRKDFLSSAEGKKLIDSYLSLSEEGQEKLMEYCDLLLSSDKYKTAHPRNDYQLTIFPDKFSVPYRPSTLNAAHAETGASPEDKKHDDDIMNDDKKWGN